MSVVSYTIYKEIIFCQMYILTWGVWSVQKIHRPYITWQIYFAKSVFSCKLPK